MSRVWLQQKKAKSEGSRVREPFITISNKTGGKLYFNTKTMKKLLNNNKHVKIGIDNLKKRMYIKQTTVNDINALKIKTNNNSNSGVIDRTAVARKLAKVAGVKKGDKQRYKVEKLKESIYYADFTEPLDEIEGEIINDWEQ